MLLKKINIRNSFCISICYFQGKKLILFKIKNLIYYKVIPYYCIFTKNEKNVLSAKIFKKSTKPYFIANFVNSFNTFQSINRKVLILHGLGLKAKSYWANRVKILQLKLGFSHLYTIKLDKEIFLKTRKNLLFFHSFNKEKLGSFIFKIKNLRFPDAYRGKGIRCKNEKLKFKIIKKK